MKTKEKSKLVAEMWEDISNEWKTIEIPLDKRETLDTELERCINSQERISLRTLKKYNPS